MILYKCVNCSSFYEFHGRAVKCCENLRETWKKEGLDAPIMIIKYIGTMKKVHSTAKV